MTALERLRQLAEALPEGGGVVLGRDFLLELVAEQGTAAGRDLSVQQIAERFGRSPSTVRSWLERGLLRGFRFMGREWRIPLAALVEFEESHRAHGKQDQGRRGQPVDLGAWRRSA